MRRMVFGSLFLIVLSQVSCSSEASETLSDRIYDTESNFAKTIAAHHNREDLVQECMKMQGFQYDQLPAPTDSPDPSMTFASVEEARLNGYGLAELAKEILEPELVEQLGEDGRSTAEVDAYADALDDPGGCRDQAIEEYPDVFDFDDETNGWLADARERTQSDGRYVEALDQWKGCMATRGFQNVEPLELFGELRDEMNSIVDNAEYSGQTVTYDKEALDRLAMLEVSAAVAEAECTPKLLQAEESVYKEYLDKPS